MTKEQIDTLMQEAGIVVVGEAVYKLCQLVAAAEREACAKVAEWVGQDKNYIGIAAAIRARGER